MSNELPEDEQIRIAETMYYKEMKKIISICDATVAAYSNSPVWYEKDIIKYMKQYADKALAEEKERHNTKTVGYIAEKQFERPILCYSINQAKHWENIGWTINELIVKPPKNY